MLPDSQCGICLKNKYEYYTYNQTSSDCICNNIAGYTIGYLNNGTYILPYMNTNNNYIINTANESICLMTNVLMTYRINTF